MPHINLRYQAVPGRKKSAKNKKEKTNIQSQLISNQRDMGIRVPNDQSWDNLSNKTKAYWLI